MAISVADNFSYKGAKPLDARFQFSSVANMKAEPVANLYDGCLAYVTATKKYYTYDSSNTSTEETGKWAELQTGGGDSYTAGDGIVIDNDEISTDNATSEDIEEILTPLPSVMSRRFKYSTEEQIVGEWIDGSPVYQKTIVESNYSISSSWKYISTGITSINNIVKISGTFISSSDIYALPYANTNDYYIALSMRTSDNAISIKSGSSKTGNLIVIIQYTKSS